MNFFSSITVTNYIQAVYLFYVGGYQSLDDFVSKHIDMTARVSKVAIATICAYLSQVSSCVLSVFYQWRFPLIL